MGIAARQSGVRASPVEIRLGAGSGLQSLCDLIRPVCHPTYCTNRAALSCAGAITSLHEWLDSSHPAPWIAPFNGRLDLKARPPLSVRVRKPYLLPYRYAGGEAWAVRLRGLVIVRKVPQAQPP